MENNLAGPAVDNLFPTAYFPSIALTAAMVQTPVILVETHETFPKQTHRNRTVILTANGPMTLSVPVVRPNGAHSLTGEIQIAYTERWNVIHWRAIESAYSSSPFFLYYRDGIEQLLMKRYTLLTQLNEALIEHLFKKLKCPCNIHHTEHYIHPETCIRDYRNRFNYKHPDQKITYKPYTQVFGDRYPFDSNVGVLDLLFNMGPEATGYLLQMRL